MKKLFLLMLGSILFFQINSLATSGEKYNYSLVEVITPANEVYDDGLFRIKFTSFYVLDSYGNRIISSGEVFDYADKEVFTQYCVENFVSGNPKKNLLKMTENPKNLIEFIQNTFPISDYAAKLIADNFEPFSYNKQTFILKEGELNNDYVYLQSGFMRCFTFDFDGNEVTTNFFSQNQMVFELSSYFQRKPSKENIQAVTDCYGFVVKYEQFQSLFHSLPEFREFGRAILVKGFVELKERTLSMINQKAEQRYETLLYSNPELLQNVPLKYIASYLGITDTSLSRIRKEFVQK